MKSTVELLIENASFCKVVTKEHYDIIWKILSYQGGFRRHPIYNRMMKTKKSYFNKNSGKFGTFLYEYVCSCLEDKGYDFNINVKNDPEYLDTLDEIYFKETTPEDYQQLVFENIKKETNGIIKAPTGAGKTFISSGIIKLFNYPKTLVIVPTSDIFKNTKKELSKWLELDIKDIGGLGNGEKNIQNITVCSRQMLDRMITSGVDFAPLNKKVKLILNDEGHLGTESILRIMNQFPNVWNRYTTTATPPFPNEKYKWFPLTAAFGNIIANLKEKDVETRVINDIKVIMFKFFTTSNNSLYTDIYRKDILLNPKRAELILEMVWYALTKEKRKNCLVLVDEYKQAKLIKDIAKDTFKYPSDFMIPTIAWRGNKSELESIKSNINNHTLKFVIATPVFKVGTNIPELDSVLLCSQRKDISNLLQKIGRGRRRTKDKNDLLILDIYDTVNSNRDKYFKVYSEKRKKYYIKQAWFKELKEILIL